MNVLKKNKKIIITISLIFLSLLFSLSGIKNLNAAELDFGNIDVELIPENPQAEEDVKVMLNSFSFDINASEVSIFLDGKLFKKEIGLKKFNFKTKKIGEKTELRISVKTTTGSIFEESLIIKPTEVDLIYEVINPYRPFGYLGKSIVLSNSEVKIYAYPTILDDKNKKIPKENLVYTWYKNFNIEIDNSGFGRNTYHINRVDAYPRNTNISVKVSALDKKSIAEGSINLAPKKTEVSFYLLEPLLPFSFKNISNPDIVSKYIDTEILAVPYFMDNLSDQKIEYEWKINGRDFIHSKNMDKNKIILVNNKENFLEKIKVSLQIINRERLFQTLLTKNFSVIFKKSETNNKGNIFSKGKVDLSIELFQSL